MCYASPGPRCQGHAQKRHDAIQAKTQEAWNKVRKVEDEIKSTGEADNGSKAYAKLLKKRDNLYGAWLDSSKKQQDAKKEIDATHGGLNDIRVKIAEISKDGSTDASLQRADLFKREKEGSRVYSERMLAYDKQEETVDGRSPSPYGDIQGIQTLTNKAKKLKAKYDNSSSPDERNKIYVKYQAAVKARDHAVKTREYASKGIINPYKASLKSNQEALKKAETEHKKAQDALNQSINKQEVIRDDIRLARMHERKRTRSTPTNYSEQGRGEIAKHEDAMKEYNAKVHIPAMEAEASARRKMNEYSGYVIRSRVSKSELKRMPTPISR